jgi:succinate dehydrogenase / fumarate reductase cytochrome b subunit
MWAYSLNRLSGILLTVYIFFHFVNISALWLGPDAWNRLMAVFRLWPFLVFDVGLLLLLVYHGLNGIRLALLALDIGVAQQKRIFWALMLFGAVALIFSAVGIFAKG